jgi:hypothetical protein
MSSTNSIPFISLSLTNELNLPAQSQSYSELMNYGSIRKQFARLIPQYMNYNNKNHSSTLKFYSDIEEYQKLKQEITSMKDSILILKEKKQKKLEQIEQLRCLMRKVGNRSYNNNNNNKNNLHFVKNNNRETSLNNNNGKYFRCDNKKQQQQKCDNNNKGSVDESDGALCLVPTTSGISSGKDDEAAPEGNYQDSGDNHGDDFINNSSSNCCNNNEWRWNLVAEENKKCFILGKEE